MKSWTTLRYRLKTNVRNLCKKIIIFFFKLFYFNNILLNTNIVRFSFKLHCTLVGSMMPFCTMLTYSPCMAS